MLAFAERKRFELFLGLPTDKAILEDFLVLHDNSLAVTQALQSRRTCLFS
jgi:hypothetical protein